MTGQLRLHLADSMIWVAQGKFYPTEFFVPFLHQCKKYIICVSNSKKFVVNQQWMAGKMVFKFPNFTQIKVISLFNNAFYIIYFSSIIVVNKNPTFNFLEVHL